MIDNTRRGTRPLRSLVAACAAAALLAQPVSAENRDPRAAVVGGLLAALLLGGKAKTRTTLEGENLRVFKELKPSRKPFAPLTYAAWQTCTYSYVKKDRDGKVFTDVLTFSSKPVRDRFLVSAKHAKGTSTALLGSDGTTYDYNWINNEDGARITRENFKAFAERALRRENAKDPANAGTRVMLDPMSAAFPVLIGSSFKSGDVAAIVKRIDGSTYAEFIYGGTVNYKGNKGILLEVVTNRDGKVEGGPILIGYYVLRQDNMMPLRAVWQTDRMELQDLIHCS